MVVNIFVFKEISIFIFYMNDIIINKNFNKVYIMSVIMRQTQTGVKE